MLENNKLKNEDFEFQLFDRVEKIKAINKQYDLEHNAYIAFSGGKDEITKSAIETLQAIDTINEFKSKNGL